MDLALRNITNHTPATMDPAADQTMSLEGYDALHPPSENALRYRAGNKDHAPRSLHFSPPAIVPLPVIETYGVAAAEFNALCQLHGLRPMFSFTEPAQGCFGVKLEFGEHVCEDQRPFPSKKQAKEIISQRGLEVLSNVELPARTKRKSEDPSSIDEENWIGLLTEYCQKNRFPPARYKDHIANNVANQKAGLALTTYLHACTMTTDAAPGRTFGSETAVFTLKAAAKRSTAKEAVLWLRENAGLRVSAPAKHRKTEDGPNISLTDAANQLTAQTPAQLVATRSLQLGVTPPSYQMKPVLPPDDAATAAWYVAAATFLPQDALKEPRLGGSVGETGSCNGQKNAKKECCKLVLILLNQILEERRRALAVG
ncbi:hypothetical protein B0A48_12481 [Cryoendolithus antarcticus]|uniref:DRBM domain-containing protein n=1 Tax=Cryoendolithus antarcticus TaxID=1507870 RepID=A0A1V8SSL4_9PEZI|nr:hypothetical protein B0A48_12481 [Cryoendolithus antarcticus]